MEKCDLVWAPDGRRLYLNDEFERRVEDEAVLRASGDCDILASDDERDRSELVRMWTAPAPSRNCARNESWHSKTSSHTSVQTKMSSRTSQTRTFSARFVKTDELSREGTLLDRTKKRLRRRAQGATEVARKAVGIPCVILCDVVGGFTGI